MEDPPLTSTRDTNTRKTTSIEELIPEDSNIPYDIKQLIEEVVDENYFFEVMSQFAQNVVIGFARMVGSQ